MLENIYTLEHTENLISPALIYYRDVIRENTRRIIAMAGGEDRLWPHVKSHKAAEMIRMQMEMGIRRFKCATIAEAEMAAEVGASHILLAYPLIGPNIARYLALAAAYPGSAFYAIGDDYAQLAALNESAAAAGITLPVLIDVNMGMNRTGIALEKVQALYEACAEFAQAPAVGLHCYDGNHNDSDIGSRSAAVEAANAKILSIQAALREKGISCELLVMGGTPSFPCRTGNPSFFLSPGTAFLGDMGYYKNLPDLAFTPGAAVFTRVVSHPAERLFTLDLGYKGIASDTTGPRGVIAGMENAEPLFQSEEHWVFAMKDGEVPAIGTGCYIIPTHICPTSALYPAIQVAENGSVVAEWTVTARNRQLTY